MKKAFTLIEFIIVIVIISVIMGVAAPVLFEMSRAWVFQSQRQDMQQNASVALDRMAREIRRIRDQGSITSAQASSLQFTDIDSRGIIFDLSSGALRRTLAPATVNTLCDNVSSLSFSYFDASNTQLSAPVASPQNIRRIVIDITFAYGTNQLSVRTSISPRRIQ